MDITSYEFFVFLFVSVIVYYLFPVKWRWLVLLVSSIYFIWKSNPAGMMAIMLSVIFMTYGMALLISKAAEKPKLQRKVFVISMISLALSLIGLKELNFFRITADIFLKLAGEMGGYGWIPIIAPLGISYYTLSLISYVCGVYWNTFLPEKNPLKFLTYASFFPLLISGPIVRFEQSARQILQGNKFDFRMFCFGLQRMIWGLFKKLVISERITVIVNIVYGDYITYKGTYVLLAVLLFPLQLYTDFSGCLDILLGAAQLFGILLPENFNLPFISGNLSEFWRRWHITLGGWLRDYILNPILKTELWYRMGKCTRKYFGKKIGKKIPVWFGLMISWFLVGFWHGGSYHYIFGVGLFMGLVIVGGQILDPAFCFAAKKMKIHTACASWKLFQSARTYLIFSFGLSFFRAESLSRGFEMWKQLFAVWNPIILFDGSVLNLGLSVQEWNVLAVSMMIMIAAALIRMKHAVDNRTWLASQNMVFRWIAIYLLIIIILNYRYYGIGGGSTSFIYQGF